MANGVLSWVNLADSGTMSAGSAVATLPVNNLQDTVVQKVWRSNASTNTYVQVDLGSAQTVGVICLAGLNIAATDTIAIALDVTTPGAGAVLSVAAAASNVVAGHGLWVYVLATSLSARYVRLTINAPSLVGTPGYIQAGRLWVGAAWQPGRNFGYGWGQNWTDGSQIDTAPRSGAEYVNLGPKRRFVSFSFDGLTEAEARTYAREMDRVAGASGQVLFVPDPASAYIQGDSVLGRISRSGGIVQRAFSTWGHEYEIRQSL